MKENLLTEQERLGGVLKEVEARPTSVPFDAERIKSDWLYF